jgi:SAM-dependent methyltransferase
MNDAEFDKHASHYRAVHATNIAISGESPEYFAEYKMRDFSAVLKELGAPPMGRFLDFGCGVGNSIAPFRAELPDATLVAADVSAESLAKLKEGHEGAVQTILIDGKSLPLEDASVDGAFACCVFHHIPPDEHHSALTELRRVLRPGAPLMVYEHNPLNPLTVRAVNTCPLDDNAILIASDRMRLLFGKAGFGSIRHDYRVFFPKALQILRPLEHYLRWLPVGAQYFVVGRA